MIIREGHTAECFYFVLSGVAAVKKLTLEGVPEDGDPVAKIVATVGRGATFGELALLQNSRSLKESSKLNFNSERVPDDGKAVAKIVATVGTGATFGELALLQNSWQVL